MATEAQLLAACPVCTLGEAAKSLVVAALLVSAAGEGGRVAPEAVTCLSALLAAAIPRGMLERELRSAHPAAGMLAQWGLFAFQGTLFAGTKVLA